MITIALRGSMKDQFVVQRLRNRLVSAWVLDAVLSLTRIALSFASRLAVELVMTMLASIVRIIAIAGPRLLLTWMGMVLT